MLVESCGHRQGLATAVGGEGRVERDVESEGDEDVKPSIGLTLVKSAPTQLCDHRPVTRFSVNTAPFKDVMRMTGDI